jgi:hypothetical protein
VAGVAAGAELPELDPPDPLEPPMFGQFAVDPPWGAPLGAVVPGAVDGAGLAAETAATPPPTRSSAEMAPVRTTRRRPFGLGSTVAGTAGGGCAGSSGWKT